MSFATLDNKKITNKKNILSFFGTSLKDDVQGSNGGRVNIPSVPALQQFQLFTKVVNDTKCTSYLDALEGTWDESILSKCFLSEENMQIIQNGIRAEVYKMSNGQYVIGQQDCKNLKMIMRSHFLQFSTNNLGSSQDITQQIVELNQTIINWCARSIMVESKAYLEYIKTINNPVMPFPHPVQASTNNKLLELKNFF